MEQTKYCGGCKSTKLTSEFHRGARAKDGLQPQCKQCKNKLKREWIAKNRDKVKWNALWTRHRLRQEDLEGLLDRQGHRCAICPRPLDVHSLHIDHDHACCPENRSCDGCRRGLLCKECNHRLGWYESTHRPEVEETMQRYLKGC